MRRAIIEALEQEEPQTEKALQARLRSLLKQQRYKGELTLSDLRYHLFILRCNRVIVDGRGGFKLA